MKTSFPFRHAQVLFLATWIMLMYEILFPRILRFLRLMQNPLEILPITFVGLAVGGIIVLWRNRVENIPHFAALLPISILACFAAFYFVGNPFILLPFLILPYIAVGAIIAQAFSSYDSHAVYITDLVGAGCGVVCVVIFLPILGAENLMLLTVAMGFLSVGVAWESFRSKLASFLCCFIFLCLTFINIQTDVGNLIWWVPDSSWARSLKPILGSSQIQENEDSRLYLSRWGLIDRVDVLGKESGVTKGPLWEKKSSIKMVADADTADLALHLDNNRATSVCRQIPPPLQAGGTGMKHLVIGVGGGWDIYHALAEGAGSITAVEINPQIVHLMTHELSNVNRFLYHQADVRIMDGRSFLHFDSGKYDRIKLSFTDTYQTFPGSNVFVENYLYTKEAMQDLFSRLAPGGRIRLGKPIHVLDMPELLRILATLFETFREMGMENPENHMILLGWPMEQSLGPSKFAFMGGQISLSREPFQPEEVEEELRLFGRPYRVMWRPDRGWVYGEESKGVSGSEETFHQQTIKAYKGFFEAVDKDAYLAALDQDFSPTTDDKPFFYDFERGHAVGLKILLKLLVVLFLVVVLPVIVYCGKKLSVEPVRLAAPAIFFAMLGLAFSILQIYFIQKFSLFLGGANYSFIVVLLSFLYFAAMGAYLGSKGGYRLAVGSILFVVVAGFLLPTVLDPLFRALFVPETGLRMLYGFLLLTPISIAIGIPFPYYLREIKGKLGDEVVPIMYAADSAFLVIGSTSVLYLAPLLGFHMIFMLGLGFYLVAGILLVVHGFYGKEVIV